MTHRHLPDGPVDEAAPPRGPWRRLRDLVGRPPGRAQVVAAVLLGLLGFAAAVQVRATRDADLDTLRQSDLVRILDDVSERAARLQAEARALQETRDRVANSSDGSAAAVEEARERARVLGILAGTLPATGPGIEVTVQDPEGNVGADVLLDALQELRDAGAEAIEISSVDGPAVRVIASTFLVDADGGVQVDGTVLEPAYRMRVIGDPTTLAAALDIPGGVLDVLRQRQAQGVVTQRPEVEITSLRAAPSPRYARPATDEEGSR